MIGAPQEVSWSPTRGARRAAQPQPRKTGGPCPLCGESVVTLNRSVPELLIERCTYCDWRN